MFGLFNKKKDNKPVYIVSAALIIAVIAISLSSILIFNKPVNPNGNGGNNTGNISAGDSPSLGSTDAKVTIIEFSDFQCPFCARFALETFPQIKANYIDTGKVRFIFRNYIVHPAAHLAAEATYCAYEQGNDKYWAYNDKLFNNQGALDSASLKAYAATIGLDTAQFNACLDSGKYTALVDKDTADGQAYGVTGTPTFLINGKKFVGAQPYASFQAQIDAALGA